MCPAREGRSDEAGLGRILRVDLRAGLAAGSGDVFAVMAADLQEPLDLVLAFREALSGGRYDVAFRGNLATSWGGPQTLMPFYAFNRAAPGGAYIDGPVRVVDGACHSFDVCSGYANNVMPHVRLETADVTAVPEPATLTLLATGLAIAGRRVRRKTSRREETVGIAKASGGVPV